MAGVRDTGEALTFEEWLRLGQESGWVHRPEGHEARTKPAYVVASLLQEWCTAHGEGQLCCLDHPQAFVLAETWPLPEVVLVDCDICGGRSGKHYESCPRYGS